MVAQDGRSGISTRFNISLACVYTAVQLFQYFVMPLWLLPRDRRWAWLLLLFAALNNPYWSLLHEAIHDLFHPSRAVNTFFGRALAVLFGSPFRILRLSHLLHHKLNRTLAEATEPYEAGKTPWPRAALGYYFQIFGGLYLGELMSSVFFFLPKALLRRLKERSMDPKSVSGILMQSWTQDSALREIRRDGVLILICFGLSLYCYGDGWPLLFGILAARGFLISFLDNVYHYRTPIDDIFYARNLWLPRPAAKVLLNFNLHGIHHQNPAIPWMRLPASFNQEKQAFQGNYFAAAVSQLGGPIAVERLPAGRMSDA